MWLTASAPIKFAADDRFWYLLHLIIAHAGVLGEGPNFNLSLHLYPPGTLIFSSYVGSGPASTVYTQKNIRKFKHPQKIFEIFANSKKYSPFCTLTLRQDPNSTANIKAMRWSLGALSVNKLSHIPKLQPISAVYVNQ